MSLNYDDIVKDTDAIVRTKSEPVTLPLCAEDETLLHDMLTYVKDSQDAEIAEKENLRPAVGNRRYTAWRSEKNAGRGCP